ncbi:UMTA methyltransferase family protein [Fonsecaea pedrosoi]|nr:UMTA methyltransferase family protein [Fonsecaea pedrosoi]
MVVGNDEYSIWRTAPDALRLCYQHFLWHEVNKSNIHPSIDLSDKPDLRIAELAAGHCLWAMQVAEEYPHAQVEASDISLGLVPPKPDLPPNLSVTKWSFFDPVPEHWKGAFDLVHIRLVIQVFGGNQDPRAVLEKFVSMLKPGGYLQWDEYDYFDADKNNVYSANDPTRIPNPEVTHNSSTQLWKIMMNTFQWPTEHFDRLPRYYADAGLKNVVADSKRPPPSIFRGFYEHWYALVAQLIPVLEARDMEASQDARQLLAQMKKDAVVDGVYSAHITKFMVGKKPGSSG